MGGILDIGGKTQRLAVKFRGTFQNSLPCHGKLGPSAKVKKGGGRFPEEAFIQETCLKLAPIGILAPWNKKPPSERIIRLIQKTIPEE